VLAKHMGHDTSSQLSSILLVSTNFANGLKPVFGESYHLLSSITPGKDVFWLRIKCKVSFTWEMELKKHV
jgi:hypothetical protein